MEGESTTEASVNRSPGRGLRNENCDDDEQRQQGEQQGESTTEAWSFSTN